MRRSITQKAQIMVVVDGRGAIATYGKLTLITNNHYGFYIKTKDLMLDESKLSKLNALDTDSIEPVNFKKNTALAKETEKAVLKYSLVDIVKLETEDKKYAWVNASYLKEFGLNRKYFIQDEKSPILITDKKDKPIGMLLPVKFAKEIAIERGQDE